MTFSIFKGMPKISRVRRMLNMGSNIVVSESANKTIKDRSVFTFGSSRTQHYLKRPYGVMNVVRWSDSSSRGICQNPLLMFNLLKTRAPDSCASILSTVGREWTSWMMLALRSLRSTDADSYIRLGTATMPLYHGVGVVTLDMTPSDSMHSSLAFTLSH